MTFAEKIKLLFSSIWKFLAPYARELMTEAGLALAEIAAEVVKEVADSLTTVDGAAKRKAAFERIVIKLEERGTSMLKHKIYKAIEDAYFNLLANKAGG